MPHAEDQDAMKEFVLERRWDEILLLVFMLCLFGLGITAAVLGGVAAPDARGFWQNFLLGTVVLIALTLPLWLVQRWQGRVRTVALRGRLREFRWMHLLLFALGLFVLAVTAAGLALNLTGRAPPGAVAALVIFLAYMVGWSFLVFRALQKLSFVLPRRRGRRVLLRIRHAFRIRSDERL